MRITSLLFLGLSLSTAMLAKDKVRIAPDANQLVRDSAAGLVSQGKMAEAVAHLSGGLQVDSRAGAKTIAVVQSLTEISYGYANQRQGRLAQSAAREALSQATALTDAVVAADSGASDFYLMLGQLCEDVLYDMPAAQSYYKKAVMARPGHARAKQKLAVIEDKQAKAQRVAKPERQ